MISDDKSLSKKFSNFFDTRVKNLDVKGPQVSRVNEDSDHIVIAINKYVGHPSIFKRKEYSNEPTACNFLEVISNDIEKEIQKLVAQKWYL